MSRPPRRSSIRQAAPVLGIVVVLLGSLMWPLLFTYSGFAGDWEHHLWLMWHQSLSIQSNHFPSFFLNSSYSVFYPTYAFYGGTLYAVGGLLSLGLGGAPVAAYVLIYVLDFAAAFGGWYWLGRMSGLNRWVALVPGLIFVTSAYYILVIYVQGDWPEFTGISMIPLMIAAGCSILRADRLRLGSALALAASSVLFFGSHNITILLGLTTLALTALAVLISVADARRSITRGGLARVVAVVVPSALVSAWYLLPTLAYHSSTRIASEYIQAREELKGNVSLVSMAHLFTFSRTAGPGMSLPVLAIVWALAGIIVLPSGSRNRTWVRILLICSGMAILIAVAMRHVGLLLLLPRPYTLIQYSYRLENYVLLALCGAVLSALVLARSGAPSTRGVSAQRRVRVWMWMAVPVCVVSLGGALQQIGAFPYPGPDRYTTLEYFGEVETGNNRDFQDATEPVVAGHDLTTVNIPPAAIHDDRVSFSTSEPPGTLIATNIGGGPNTVHVDGATVVGADSETGNMVLQLPSAASAGTAHVAAQTATTPGSTVTISISTAHNLPIVLGHILTFIGLAALTLELLTLLVRRLPLRRVRVRNRPQMDTQREAVDRGLL